MPGQRTSVAPSTSYSTKEGRRRSQTFVCARPGMGSLMNLPGRFFLYIYLAAREEVGGKTFSLCGAGRAGPGRRAKREREETCQTSFQYLLDVWNDFSRLRPMEGREGERKKEVDWIFPSLFFFLLTHTHTYVIISRSRDAQIVVKHFQGGHHQRKCYVIFFLFIIRNIMIFFSLFLPSFFYLVYRK